MTTMGIPLDFPFTIINPLLTQHRICFHDFPIKTSIQMDSLTNIIVTVRYCNHYSTLFPLFGILIEFRI